FVRPGSPLRSPWCFSPRPEPYSVSLTARRRSPSTSALRSCSRCRASACDDRHGRNRLLRGRVRLRWIHPPSAPVSPLHQGGAPQEVILLVSASWVVHPPHRSPDD